MNLNRRDGFLSNVVSDRDVFYRHICLIYTQKRGIMRDVEAYERLTMHFILTYEYKGDPLKIRDMLMSQHYAQIA